MRKYSSFFSLTTDKRLNELSVCEELLKYLNENSVLKLHSLRTLENDPPDCICLDENNKPVAIEVVELVCEETTKLNEKGNQVFRIWESDEFTEHLNKLLIRKDQKKYLDGPYVEVIVCVYTDEPTLTFKNTIDLIRSKNFGPFHQITQSFLMFSYNPDPIIKSYQVIKVTP